MRIIQAIWSVGIILTTWVVDARGEATTQPVAVAEVPAILLSLNLKDASGDEALALLCKPLATSIDVVPPNLWTPPNQPPKVSLDLDAVPFWSAMAHFCKSAHVHPQKVDGRATMTLVQGDAAGMLGGRLDDRGLFAVVATGGRRDRNINIANSSIGRSDRIDLTVYVDPRVRLAKFSGNAHVDIAEDNRRLSLLAPAEGENDVGGVFWDDATWTFNCSAPIIYHPGRGTKLTRFKGSIRVLVATKITNL
jgi:hypothetical protein